MDHIIDGEEQEPGDDHADHPGQHSDDKGLRIEDGGDVSLGGADRAQDTDLLGPLQNGDVGDDPDHDGGHDQGDGDKRDQHVGDSVHDRLHGAHQDSCDVRVLQFLLLLGDVVVVLQKFGEAVFGLEVVKIERDPGGVVLALIAQLQEIALIGVVFARDHCLHDPAQLVLIFVELEGIRKLVLIDRQKIVHSAEHVADGRHGLGQRFTGPFGDQSGHVFFGQAVSLFKEGGAVVFQRLIDGFIRGRQIAYGHEAVGIGCQAPVIVVEGLFHDLLSGSGIELDLVDLAHHFSDALVGDGFLLVGVQVCQRNIFGGRGVAAVLEFFDDHALKHGGLRIVEIHAVDHSVGFRLGRCALERIDLVLQRLGCLLDDLFHSGVYH